jgi:hypothetical protein
LGVNIIHNGDYLSPFDDFSAMYLIFPTTRGQPFSLSKTQHNVEEELAWYELLELDAEGDDDVDVEF